MNQKFYQKSWFKIISIFLVICVSIFGGGVFSLLLSGNYLNLEKDFNLTGLNISTEKVTSNTWYDGEAKIYCRYTNQDYLVEYSYTLLSGGDEEDIGNTHYANTIVHNGTGTITTWTSGENTPKYDIQLIGYTALSK